MSWLPTLAFAILLLSVQYDAAQSWSSASSRSPWANPAKAGSLMNCLINKIASSNVLPQQEKEDLESIMDTLMSAIKGASAKGKSSAAQLKAINMAVASSLAELVVAEDASNQASIAVKTQALSGALEQCFQAVMGTVDRKFINEINDLIRMFAREAASETNEIPDQGASYAAGSSVSSSFQATDQNYQASSRNSGSQFSQAATSQYSGGAGSSYIRERQFASNTGQPIFGQTSTSGQSSYSQAGAVQSGLVSRLSNALANTSTMRTILSSSASRETVSNVVQKTVQTLASTLGINGNELSRITSQAISQVPAGSDTSTYVRALSTALVNGGVLNESNIDKMGSRVVSAIINGVSSAAQGFGINVDTSNIQNDISSSSSFLSSSSSSNSYSQRAASTTSGAETSYTGAQSGSVSRQSSFGQTESSGSSGSTGYTGAQSGSVSRQSSFGQTSGFRGSAGEQGGFGQQTGFGGPAGGPGAFGPTTGAPAGLISRVANALANSSTMRAVLRRGVSQQIASNVVQEQLRHWPVLSVSMKQPLQRAFKLSLKCLRVSDTSSYAQAFHLRFVMLESRKQR
ncbi:hypothetical protein HNY73_007004 [Argiope bruennichi]|uniref:Aciniform spidroin 1 variant 1 n=1 Tax=Argiope bruennichi TaxID=94029 RepID=A0A8T0FFA1_ARGBR|nr:hypothetical protein HNY73_007004 [Argiope bruennichi]